MTLQDVDLALANKAHELATLQRQRDALLVEAERPWPKRVTLYAYARESQLWEEGILRLLDHAEEYTITVDVAEDGRVTVVSAT